MSLIKNPVSANTRKISLVGLLVIAGWFSLMSLKKWENPLSWDMFGYYLYTPATIIWKDPALIDFSKVEQIKAKYDNTPYYYQGSKTEKGGWMIKYTMGIAVMELPFFMVAHMTAPLFGYDKDGFSQPYQRAMMFCCFFYLILGFVILRKSLLKFFSDSLSSVLMLLIVVGTNFYITASSEPPSIHIIEFSLFSTVFYLTVLWHENPSKKLAILLGISVGLSILVRPTDALIILIPLLWNVTSFKTLKEKLKILFSDYKTHTTLAGILCFVIVFLQMCYWKKVNGNWLTMSYNNNPGEGFEFLHPYILQVLFSFRKGWFVYTPLMIFAVLGFRIIYKKQRGMFWPILIFFILNVYVISSWSCWWYAGCYGQRAMIESYAILIFPLGYFIEGVLLEERKTIKWVVLLFVISFVILNIFQSWQYKARILEGSRMTMEYYFKIFGKRNIKSEYQELLMVDRSQGGYEHFSQENKYKKRILFFDDFDTPDEAGKEQHVDSISRSGIYSVFVNDHFIYTPNNELPFNLITKKDHAWIRTTFWYLTKTDPKKNPLGLVVTFTNSKGEPYKYSVIDVGAQSGDSVNMGHWNKYVFDYLTPEVRNENDKINIYFWLRGKYPVYIDDFKVEAYERQEKEE
jgi:hypothetical protein